MPQSEEIKHWHLLVWKDFAVSGPAQLVAVDGRMNSAKNKKS